MSATINPIVVRAADAARITGFSQMELRDARRHGHDEAGDGTWTAYDLRRLARLLFVKTLIGAGFRPQAAWELAQDEYTRNIILHAARLPGAIVDRTSSDEFRKNPVKWVTELMGARYSAGHLFMFGPTIEPASYESLEQARQLATGAGPHVITTIDLKELARVLVERAGPIATIEDAGDAA